MSNACVLDKENYALPDDAWHVTSYYENIRTKLRNLDPSKGACISGYNGQMPTRFCNTSIHVSDKMNVLPSKGYPV
jgi:hypothetical protein